ncbi:hypothetical protein B0H13DRAFT_1858354 [Mycena leptocephala]|nr:hypothetical protein B0H13DRAFT_1858354 [Mycena leptocephala]
MEKVEKFGFGSRIGAWWGGWNSPEGAFYGSHFCLILEGMWYSADVFGPKCKHYSVHKGLKSHKKPPWITAISLFNAIIILQDKSLVRSRKGFNSPQGQKFVELRIFLCMKKISDYTSNKTRPIVLTPSDSHCTNNPQASVD